MLSRNYSFTNPIFNMYEQDLTLDNLIRLICYKTQPTLILKSDGIFIFFHYQLFPFFKQKRGFFS